MCISTHTNIVLDDDLVEEAMRHTKIRNKRELIDLALREFVERHRRKYVLELRGKVRIDEDYDYKARPKRDGS